MTRGIKECFRNMSYFMQIILLLFSLIMLWFLNKEVLFITFVGGVLTYVSTFGNNITDSFFPCWFLNVHMFTPLLASVKTNEQFHISIVKIIHISNSVPLFLKMLYKDRSVDWLPGLSVWADPAGAILGGPGMEEH